MTRKSYPPLPHGPIVECPCCRRSLEIVAYIDGESFYLDDASLHATAVPLREQLCIQRVSICSLSPTRRRGAVCNWLGPTCNDALHVTPASVTHRGPGRRRSACFDYADIETRYNEGRHEACNDGDCPD